MGTNGARKGGGQGTGREGEGGGRREEEGEKTAGWGTRTARVLEDIIDMQDTICIEVRRH